MTGTGAFPSRHSEPAEGFHRVGASDVLAPADFEPWPDSDVHVEWGATGAVLAAERGDVVVVIDIFSFSTTLCIAASRHFTSLVYSPDEIARMGGPQAAARSLAARPLSKRRGAMPGEVSLSPMSLLNAEPGQRVLFTSLNGASVVAAAARAPVLLIAALRNVTASSETAFKALKRSPARRISVIACGEQWSSVAQGLSGLRPSIEDWVGAGVLCRQLRSRGLTLSTEAAAAAGMSLQVDELRHCVSARELLAAGFTEDVDLALDVDVCQVVPVRDVRDVSGRAFIGQFVDA